MPSFRESNWLHYKDWMPMLACRLHVDAGLDDLEVDRAIELADEPELPSAARGRRAVLNISVRGSRPGSRRHPR